MKACDYILAFMLLLGATLLFIDVGIQFNWEGYLIFPVIITGTATICLTISLMMDLLIKDKRNIIRKGKTDWKDDNK